MILDNKNTCHNVLRMCNGARYNHNDNHFQSQTHEQVAQQSWQSDIIINIIIIIRIIIITIIIITIIIINLMATYQTCECWQHTRQSTLVLKQMQKHKPPNWTQTLHWHLHTHRTLPHVQTHQFTSMYVCAHDKHQYMDVYCVYMRARTQRQNTIGHSGEAFRNVTAKR